MEKVRKAFYVEEELLGQVDALLPQADVRSTKRICQSGTAVLYRISHFGKNRKLYADNHLLCHACNGK